MPYGFALQEAQSAQGLRITPSNWQELLGEKRAFEDLYQFFKGEFSRLGMQQTLDGYAPTLLAGCAGSLIHGLIHLGWALDTGHETMIVEGDAPYLLATWNACQQHAITAKLAAQLVEEH